MSPPRLELLRQHALGRAKSKRQQAAYPNLARLEDVILESCDVDDLDESRDCMNVYDKLLTMHFKSQQECDLESMRCVVLEVVDRMVAGVSDKDGLQVLVHFRRTVDAFERMHKSREEAFDLACGDSDGVDKACFRAALGRVGVSFPDRTVDRLFMGADGNHDGVISRDEFNEFMLAGVFAAEPLKRLDAATTEEDSAQKTFQLMRWATSGMMAGPPPAAAI